MEHTENCHRLYCHRLDCADALKCNCGAEKKEEIKVTIDSSVVCSKCGLVFPQENKHECNPHTHSWIGYKWGGGDGLWSLDELLCTSCGEKKMA